MRCVGSVLTGLSLADSDVNLDAFIEAVNGVAKDCRLSLGVPGAAKNTLAAQQSDDPTAFENAHTPVFVELYKPGFGSLLLEILQILRAAATNSPSSTDAKDGLPPFPSILRYFDCLCFLLVHWLGLRTEVQKKCSHEQISLPIAAPITLRPT
ncbi:unnamed protein product [Dibothriocephalus latus]|uniref:Uncharacterized protein n=1 Tax=Dibothriocephalus latus TaxID=60516 RepID=A0A3P7QZQ7_DIBLA|nr:unnamed protein product [Dibothriocephalus latus]